MDNYEENIEVFSLGQEIECPDCGALKFSSERRKICCQGGKVKLCPLTVPDELLAVFQDSKNVRNIRAYNQAFAMSSIGGAKVDQSVNNGIRRTVYYI